MNKSQICAQVLELMDKDLSYQQAVQFTLLKVRKELEKELDFYI